jgi:TonB family protein
MRKIILAAAMLLWVDAAKAADTYVGPTIIAHPTSAQWKAAIPEALSRGKLNGGAAFACTMAVGGEVTDCSLLNETPQGLGVAAGARTLLPLYRGLPARKNGVARAENILMTIQFFTMPTKAGALNLPSRPEILASAPPGAEALGDEATVNLSCLSKATGGLELCRAVAAAGLDPTITQAAVTLASKAKTEPRLVGGKPVASLTDFYVRWAEPPFDVPADWLKRPDARAFRLAYPARAMSEGKAGRAMLNCTITPQGALAGCISEGEEPSGYGFGDAAVALSRGFFFRPATKAGQPVASPVRIPINFTSPGGAPAPGSVTSVAINLSPLWVTAPTAAQVAAAFPTKARAKSQSGQVMLQCHVEVQGALKGCSTVGETPAGQGYAAAARTLVASFQMKMGENAGAVGIVNIRFSLIDPESPGWTSRQLTKPRWKVMPDPTKAQSVYPDAAADAGVERGTARVQCMVGEGGAFADCVALEETPKGLGFAEASRKIASVFVVNPWTDEGLPVDGVRLTLPIALVREAAKVDP